MSNNNEDLSKVIGDAAIFLGAVWLLGKLLQNEPVTRCPYCNLVVKDQIRRCPRCGEWLEWE